MRGYSRTSVHDIAYVLSRMQQSDTGPRATFTVTGVESPKPTAQARGARLRTLGARLVVGPEDRVAYARLFVEHDVLWMPQRTSYLTQSSGKTLDALVQGLPVVAVAPSWPATQSMRWTGTDLSYRDIEQAAQLFRGLADEIGAVQARLAAISDEVRTFHSPSSTVLSVLEIAQGIDPPVTPPPLASTERAPGPSPQRMPATRRDIRRATAAARWSVSGRLVARGAVVRWTDHR